MQTNERAGPMARAGHQPSIEDMLAALRERFGDRHQESYEHGKHEFRDALVERFDLDRDRASRLVEELEQAQVIRFKSAGEASTRNPSGPRVGLFDEPGPVTDSADLQPTPDYGGRYWSLGREDDVPGVP